MTEHITLEAIDVDGAIQEAAADAGDTRSDFLRKGLFAGGSLVAGGVLMGGMPAIAEAKPSAKQDRAILNYALTLEYLEAEFYKQAVASGALTGAALELGKVIAEHEAAHVKALKKALGRSAVKSPTFAFGETVTNQDKFLATAFVLENTGVAAYLGQANLPKADVPARVRARRRRGSPWRSRVEYSASLASPTTAALAGMSPFTWWGFGERAGPPRGEPSA